MTQAEIALPGLSAPYVLALIHSTYCCLTLHMHFVDLFSVSLLEGQFLGGQRWCQVTFHPGKQLHLLALKTPSQTLSWGLCQV